MSVCYRLLAVAAAALALAPLAMPELAQVALPLSAALSLGALLLADRRGMIFQSHGSTAPNTGSGCDEGAFSWFEQAPLGVVRLDSRYRILQCNPAFVRLFQLGRAVAPGLAFSALLAPESVAPFQEAIRSLSAASDVEAMFQGERNRKFRLHCCRDIDDGHLLFVVDITTIKEFESKQVQLGKMQALGQLAGGIAHDFNNLLTAMVGFCDLLLQRHKAGDASFADIMQIKQNANRATSLVRQLLAFSRQQTLRPKLFDITEVLNELSHLLRRLIGQAISLRLTYGRDLWPVRVDQNQFEQVIVNLVVNARDAMPQGGEIVIHSENTIIESERAAIHETMPAGEYVLIQIQDTGCGIPPSAIGQIFEPFFTTKAPGEGTGLGLSTVYGIVHQTGGFLEVLSEPGRGSRFSIYLPSCAAAAVEKADSTLEPNEADRIGDGTFLLVEDEDPVRLFIARALRSRGYRVLEARSGEAALELLGKLEEPLDMMITDVIMPNTHLPALIETVRADRPELKILCISGHTDDALLESIMSAGNITFLPKPFSLKELARRVYEVMTGR